MAKLPRLRQFTLLILICATTYIGLMCQVQVLFSSSLVLAPNDKQPISNWETAALPGKQTAVDSVHENTDSERVGDASHLDQDLVRNTKHQRESLGVKMKNITNHGKFHRMGVQPGRTTDIRHRTVHFVQVGDLYVYGAFLDHRQKENPTVRLLVLKHKQHHSSLLCSVTAGGRHLTLFPQVYTMCENHGKVYEGLIYSCVLPATLYTLPQNVSVVSLSQGGRHRTETTFNLDVIPTQRDLEKGYIGVCVPPLFGDLSLAAIIHFLQMCKVLGADRVFMYLANVSSEIRKFLLHQSSNDPSLSVIDWKLPGNISDSSDAIWYHGQLLAIQDCLYSNMASFRYLLFLDLDEMLVPQDTFGWPDMLSKIFSTVNRDSVAALSFRSTFFDPNQVPEDFESIHYFQYLHRSSASKVRNKLLVQPHKVFELGIHHLSKPLSDDFLSMNISETIAHVHHYRPCVQTYEPEMNCFQTREDRTMLRYKEMLTHLSHRVITDASKLFA